MESWPDGPIQKQKGLSQPREPLGILREFSLRYLPVVVEGLLAGGVAGRAVPGRGAVEPGAAALGVVAVGVAGPGFLS